MPPNYLKLPIGKSLPQWKEKFPPPKTNMQGSYCFLEPLNIDMHSVSLFEAILEDNNKKKGSSPKQYSKSHFLKLSIPTGKPSF